MTVWSARALSDIMIQVASTAESSGLIQQGEWAADSAEWQNAWNAICKVWASKWNDRAWLSRTARGIKDGDLKMAALLQKVQSEYMHHRHQTMKLFQFKSDS